jgi:uncharacterized protein (DUF1501 family)
MRTSRRQFMAGCCSAIAAMAGSRLSFLGMADAQSMEARGETLVIVFLRGGMDGLSLIPPIDGEDRAHYELARPRLKIPTSGAGAAIPLNAQFGLHPAAGSLLPLFQSGKLAIVHAVGSSGSRSHFDAMKYLELGTPGEKGTPDGWLTRHLRSSPGIPETVMIPALATGGMPPTSLLGNSEFINLIDATTFSLSQIGNASWAAGEQWTTLRRLYQMGDSVIHRGGVQAMNAAGLVESFVEANYQPGGGANYPPQLFGQHLKLVAQLIKADAGLRVATVDLGGWDTHENQGVAPGGHFSSLVQLVSDGLAAFYADLDASSADAPSKRVTVVVMSEFGRRIRENANQGTDHGTANPVLVLGGNVRGGLHGDWPGLHPDQRFDNADLAPTNDLRRLLSEILIRRAGNPNLGEVFPGYAGYSPLGIAEGPDLTPEYSANVPVTPTNFAAAWAGDGVVRLTWTPAEHATHYRIQRRDEGVAVWDSVIVAQGDAGQYEDAGLQAGAQPTYRIQAFNAHGEGEFVEAAPAPISDPRAQWRLIHFGTTSNSGVAADDAVATADGLSNFVKYALGLDPLQPAWAETTGFAPGRPRFEVESGRASLVYVRPVDRTDVRYEVRASGDLGGWSVLEDVSEGVADGMERRRATLDVADAKARFLRLDVAPR